MHYRYYIFKFVALITLLFSTTLFADLAGSTIFEGNNSNIKINLDSYAYYNGKYYLVWSNGHYSTNSMYNNYDSKIKLSISTDGISWTTKDIFSTQYGSFNHKIAIDDNGKIYIVYDEPTSTGTYGGTNINMVYITNKDGVFTKSILEHGSGYSFYTPSKLFFSSNQILNLFYNQNGWYRYNAKLFEKDLISGQWSSKRLISDLSYGNGDPDDYENNLISYNIVDGKKILYVSSGYWHLSYHGDIRYSGHIFKYTQNGSDYSKEELNYKGSFFSFKNNDIVYVDVNRTKLFFNGSVILELKDNETISSMIYNGDKIALNTYKRIDGVAEHNSYIVSKGGEIINSYTNGYIVLTKSNIIFAQNNVNPKKLIVYADGILPQPKILESLIDTINVPFHSEVKPDNLNIYFKVSDSIALSDLKLYIDGVEAPYTPIMKRLENNNSIVSVVVPMLNEGVYTETLKDGNLSATVKLNLKSIPFREASEEAQFIFNGSGFAGYAAEAKFEVLGTGAKVEAGAKGSAKVGSNITNGIDQYIIADEKSKGELYIGVPSKLSAGLEGEANSGKMSIDFLKAFSANVNLAEIKTGITISKYVVKYPKSLQYPNDVSLIGNLYIPNIIKAILPKSDMILATISNPEKELFIDSYAFNFDTSVLSTEIGTNIKKNNIKIAFPFLSFKASLFELNYLKKITYIKGYDNGGDINLVKQTYNNLVWNLGKLTSATKDVGALQSNSEVSTINYFERGQENGHNIARIELRMDKGVSYPKLANGITYDRNEVSFVLSDSDFNLLKNNFNLDTFKDYDFKKPVEMESWLIGKDTNIDLPIANVAIGAGVGLEGKLSFQANRSEKVLAGVAYRVGESVYPIYHNTFSNGRFLNRNINFTKDYPNTIMIEAFKATSSKILTKVKEALLGSLNTITEAATTTGKKIIGDGMKIAQVIIDGTSNLAQKANKLTFKTYTYIQHSLKRPLYSAASDINYTQQAINNANLEFISDLIQIDVNETSSGANVIFYPKYSTDINGTVLVKFDNGYWKKLDNTTYENGGIKYFVVQSGLYALVGDFTKKQEIFSDNIVNVDVSGSLKLTSNPLLMVSGKKAKNRKFKIEIKDAFSVKDGNISYFTAPINISNSAITDDEGRIVLNIDANSLEGEATVVVESDSGYTVDRFRVYVTKETTPKPIENYEINISVDKEAYKIGDMVKIDINTNKDYNSSVIKVRSPSGIQYSGDNIRLNQDGVWEITVQVADINGYLHLKKRLINVAGISLAKGWNLISGNILPSSLKSTIGTVWKYKNGNWFAYSPDKNISTKLIGAGYGSFSTLYNAEGFWMHTDKDVELIGLRNDNDVNMSIGNGWELHGTPIDINVSDLTCKGGNLEISWKYKDGQWKLYVPSINNTVYTFNTIHANEGFWTYCK